MHSAIAADSCSETVSWRLVTFLNKALIHQAKGSKQNVYGTKADRGRGKFSEYLISRVTLDLEVLQSVQSLIPLM